LPAPDHPEAFWRINRCQSVNALLAEYQLALMGHLPNRLRRQSRRMSRRPWPLWSTG